MILKNKQVNEKIKAAMKYYMINRVNGKHLVLSVASTESEVKQQLLNSQNLDLESPAPKTISYSYIKSDDFNSDELAAIKKFEDGSEN